MRRQKIIISVQFVISIILNILRYSELIEVITNVIFQLIIASFGGLLLSYLMQYYRRGQWLKYWIWVYAFMLIFNILHLIGFIS